MNGADQGSSSTTPDTNTNAGGGVVDAEGDTTEDTPGSNEQQESNVLAGMLLTLRPPPPSLLPPPPLRHLLALPAPPPPPPPTTVTAQARKPSVCSYTFRGIGMSLDDEGGGVSVSWGKGSSSRPGKKFRFKPTRGMIAAQEQRQQAEREKHKPAARALPLCYPGETYRLRVARTQGLSECLEITSACEREAVEEAAKDCVTRVSEFLAGEKCPEVVAVLASRDCKTVQAALAQITRQKCLAVGGARSRRPLFMDSLGEWYCSLFPQPSKRACDASPAFTSPSTSAAAARYEPAVKGIGVARWKRKHNSRRPAVVVLFEDVEGLDKQVLRDLITVLAQPPCSSSATANRWGAIAPRTGRGFPLAFVAIASAGVGFPIDRLCPSAARHISLQNFSFPTSRACADVLYYKLFIQGRLPFSLGSRALAWMKGAFNASHQSLGTLSRQVQRAAMEHFSRSGSYLCLQNCRPWLRRRDQTQCTAYEDLFGEVLAFMSQKLRRDSVRMPQAQLETLSAFSLPKQDEGVSDGIQAGLEVRHGPALANDVAVEGMAVINTETGAAVALGDDTASPAPASHGAGSAAPAVQDALSIHGASKGTPSAAQTNQGATSADKAAMSMAVNNTGNRNSHRGDGGDHAQWRIQPDASPEPSSERSAGHLPQALTPPEGSSEISSRYDASGEPTERSSETSADGAPPEGSSARSVDRSMDLDRPRAIQGLDEGEACYLRRAASRVQTLWAKADSEGWVVEDEEFALLWGRDAGGISGVSGISSSGGGVKAAPSRGNRLFTSALNQTSNEGGTPQGCGADAAQDIDTQDAAADAGNPGLGEGRGARDTEQSGDDVKKSVGFGRSGAFANRGCSTGDGNATTE
eukprot:jgi/Undpi1/7848/HiC_scaffold_23.g10320.m1